MTAPDCMGVPVNIPIYNNKQSIPISWHVDFEIKPGHVVYCGRLDNNMGCGRVYFAAYTDPRYEGDNAMFKGKIITPNGINMLGDNGKIADDPTRVRTDGLGTPDFGMPIAIAE